jgi:hypothetical protein
MPDLDTIGKNFSIITTFTTQNINFALNGYKINPATITGNYLKSSGATVDFIMLSSDKSITDFEISGVNGIIIEDETNTIDLTLPYGTNVANLVPTITHTGEFISPKSGAVQDFTGPVTYTVTAEDSST